VKSTSIVADAMRFALWASKLRRPPSTVQAASHFGYDRSTAHRRVQAYRDACGLPPLSTLVERADTYHGTACSICRNAERYRSNGRCVVCQRKHHGGRA
jgi:hypothetical protein